jgi:DNA mismatch repair protein MutS2
LKVMANKVPGIINGAMAFDEENLLPLYKLIIGKPGSSYTFSIAERIGLAPRLVSKAKALVDEDHFSLDKLLNRTEQDLRQIEKKESELQKLVKENERLKKEMTVVLDKERHRQEVELLKQQNQITEERIAYLKDMERKMKQILLEWKKAEDKSEPIKQMHNLLFKKKDQIVTNKLAKKVQGKYEEVSSDIVVGAQVKLKKNYQVGAVKEIRGKRAIVQVGLVPISVELGDLVVVQQKGADNEPNG